MIESSLLLTFANPQKDRDIETFEINIKDLTFNQLQKLKLNPVLHDKEYYDFEEDTGMPCNQPFASFQTVLESVDPQCGFNVEIKYPQKKIVSSFVNFLSQTNSIYQPGWTMGI